MLRKSITCISLLFIGYGITFFGIDYHDKLEDAHENELLTDMPDMQNSRVIIVGHSGATSNSYFKNIHKLKKKDTIYLYYDKIKYTYKVTDRYDIIKNGTLALESNHDKKTLTLVTCKGNTKQLVIIATLTKEETI